MNNMTSTIDQGTISKAIANQLAILQIIEEKQQQNKQRQDQSLNTETLTQSNDSRSTTTHSSSQKPRSESREIEQSDSYPSDRNSIFQYPPPLDQHMTPSYCHSRDEEKEEEQFNNQESRQYVSCKNEQTPHNVRLEYVSSYMREWIRENDTTNNIGNTAIDNDNYHQEVILPPLLVCRAPCCCCQTSNTKACESHLVIHDWENILSNNEVELVRRILRTKKDDKREINIGNSSVVSNNNTSTTTVAAAVARRPPPTTTTTPTRTTRRQQNVTTSPLASYGEASVLRRKQSLKNIERFTREFKTYVSHRRCPFCDTVLVKENANGNNKVVCSFCQACVCYCCENIIPMDGYDHFSMTHCYNTMDNKKCPLWTERQFDRDQDQAIVKEGIFHLAKQLQRRL